VNKRKEKKEEKEKVQKTKKYKNSLLFTFFLVNFFLLCKRGREEDLSLCS